MTNLRTLLDPVLFSILPYVAVIMFLLMTIQRYRVRTFTYSSLSSQFLENRQHFWAVVPFHYGILAILAAHFGTFLLPGTILAWNSEPLRLYLLEITGLVFALLSLVGLAASIWRRATVTKVRIVTSTGDWVVFAMLLFQVLSGIAIALHYGWGSSWYAGVAAPYLWSIVRLNPEIDAIAAMPWMVRVHVINAWLLIGVFPFTRLVHVLVAPNPYFWRKPQVTRWYGKPNRSSL